MEAGNSLVCVDIEHRQRIYQDLVGMAEKFIVKYREGSLNKTNYKALYSKYLLH